MRVAAVAESGRLDLGFGGSGNIPIGAIRKLGGRVSGRNPGLASLSLPHKHCCSREIHVS